MANQADETFSSGDVFRLVSRNLTKAEKKDILLFFIVILPASGIVLGALEEILTTMFKPTKLIFLILRLLRIYSQVVERLVSIDAEIMIWALLSKESRKQALLAVKRLQKDFFLL